MLKPCPFCGGKDISTELVGEYGNTPFAARCNDCDAEGPTAMSVSEAGEKWNIRKSKTQYRKRGGRKGQA